MSVVMAAVLAFLLMLLSMPRFLSALVTLSPGQTIYELGPSAHKKKQGTPNMGGLVIASSLCLSWLLASLPTGIPGEGVALLLLVLACMAIGFTDDWLKSAYRRHEGLKPRQKLIAQFAAGALFSFYCAGAVGTGLRLPLSERELDLGPAYIPLMTLAVVFMTNSANLQDGVDGILSTVTVVGGTALGVMALALAAQSVSSSTPAGAVAHCSLAMAGACLGFLRFNRYPARIFMGDTGSMLIGAVFAGAAMLLKVQLWLIPLCFTLIVSSLSVIVQRFYFKLTGGKRILRMSPLHHHFELGGMSEQRIVLLYGGVALVLSFLSLLLFTPLTGR